MQDSSEGLSYGHDNDKFEKADKREGELEKGKYMLLGEMGNSPEHDAAAKMRLAHKGSEDPMYGNSRKNVCG